jgi:hypothetical protein
MAAKEEPLPILPQIELLWLEVVSVLEVEKLLIEELQDFPKAAKEAAPA